jgi:hypothetical protein
LALERCRRGFVVAEVGLRRNVAPAAVDDMATVAGDRDGGCGLWVGGSLGWEVICEWRIGRGKETMPLLWATIKLYWALTKLHFSLFGFGHG